MPIWLNKLPTRPIRCLKFEIRKAEWQRAPLSMHMHELPVLNYYVVVICSFIIRSVFFLVRFYHVYSLDRHTESALNFSWGKNTSQTAVLWAQHIWVVRVRGESRPTPPDGKSYWKIWDMLLCSRRMHTYKGNKAKKLHAGQTKETIAYVCLCVVCKVFHAFIADAFFLPASNCRLCRKKHIYCNTIKRGKFTRRVSASGTPCNED